MTRQMNRLQMFGAALDHAGKERVMQRVATVRTVLVLLLLGLSAQYAASVSAQTQNQVRSSSFTYNATTGILETETIQPGSADHCVRTTYQHDAFGNRQTVTTSFCGTNSAKSFPTRSSSSRFDARTNHTSTPANDTHGAGGYETRSTNAAGHVKSMWYDPRFGTATLVVEARAGTPDAGLETRVEYDGFGRKIRETKPDGTGMRYRYVLCPSTVPADNAACINFSEGVQTTYDSQLLFDQATGQPTTQAVGRAVTEYYVEATPVDRPATPTSVPTKNGPATRIHFDALNREIAKETEAYDGRWVRSLTTYDHNGLEAASYSAHYASATPPVEVRRHTSRRDLRHRPVTTTIYTLNGQTPATATITMEFNGLEQTQIDPRGARTVTRKNVMGQVAQTIDADGATINMAYNAVGDLIRTVDALGNRTSIEYENNGVRSAMTDPNTGRWTYEHDALGQLKRQVDAKGQVSTMQYDLIGRMTERANATQTSRWFYDNYEGGTTVCAQGMARLCEVTSLDYRERHTYDTIGRVTQTTTTLDRAYTTSVTYDGTNGWVSTQRYPTGFTVRNEYSTGTGGRIRGVLERVVDANNAARVFWSISENPAAAFNARGQLQRSRLGNGLETDNAYDLGTGVALNLRTGTVTAVGGAVTSNTHHALSYRFDANLNPTERVNGATNLREEFAYDLQNRLTDYRIRPSDTAQNRDMRVVYNAIGNILFKTGSGIYTYNASGANSVRPHAVTNVGGTTYNYDANGHLETTTGTLARTHAWTAFNQPASMSANGTTMTFKYDADFQRMERVTTTGTTTRRLYMLHPDNAGGLSFERELTFNSGTLTQTENRHYINTPAGVVAVVKTFGADLAAATATPSTDPTHIQYWHKDHLGSVVLVTNANGVVAERTSFDAWGARLRGDGFNFVANDPARNPAHGDRGYTGHEHLDELGVIHMNGRIYDPILGRFFSPDPFIQAPDMLANYNRYSYVLNRPMSMTDPSGEIWIQVAIFVAGAILHSEGNKHWKVVGSLMMAFASYKAGLAVLTDSGVLVATSGIKATAAAGSGFLTGLVTTGGDVGAAAESAFFAAITAQIGGMSEGFGQVAAHAAVGCARGAMSGGECGPSALAATFGKLATYGMEAHGIDPESFVATAVVGGTASVIGGGKFSNGAMTAAYGWIYNYMESEIVSAYRGHAGHHRMTKQWAKANRNNMTGDALDYASSKSNIGGDLSWGKGSKNEHQNDAAHRQYQIDLDRETQRMFPDRSPSNKLTLNDVKRLDDQMKNHPYNKKMEDVARKLRSEGKFNRRFLNRMGRGARD
jgi:RHS repeat-associated protein